MGLKQLIRNWLSSNDILKPANIPIEGYPTTKSSSARLEVVPAVNGHVITIGKFKPNPHGPDWSVDYYLVPEGVDLGESLKTCLAIACINR